MSDESTELVVVLDVCLGILSSRTEDDTVEDLMALAASGNCLRSRGTQMPIIVLCQSAGNAHIPLRTFSLGRLLFREVWVIE
jgi:hypothetical protein